MCNLQKGTGPGHKKKILRLSEYVEWYESWLSQMHNAPFLHVKVLSYSVLLSNRRSHDSKIASKIDNFNFLAKLCIFHCITC